MLPPAVFKASGRRRYVESLAMLKSYPKVKSVNLSRVLGALSVILDTAPAIDTHKFTAGSADEWDRLKGVSRREIESKAGGSINRAPRNTRNIVEVALRLARLAGAIVIVGQPWRVALTELGSTVKRETRGLNDVDRFVVLATAGLLYKTKAKLLAFSIINGAYEPGSIYNSVVASLFSGGLRGYERAAFSLADEIALVERQESRVFMGEYEIGLAMLIGLGLAGKVGDKYLPNGGQGLINAPRLIALHKKLVGEPDLPLPENYGLGGEEIEEILKGMPDEILRILERVAGNTHAINTNLERINGIPYSLPSF